MPKKSPQRSYNTKYSKRQYLSLKARWTPELAAKLQTFLQERFSMRFVLEGSVLVLYPATGARRLEAQDAFLDVLGLSRETIQNRVYDVAVALNRQAEQVDALVWLSPHREQVTLFGIVLNFICQVKFIGNHAVFLEKTRGLISGRDDNGNATWGFQVSDIPKLCERLLSAQKQICALVGVPVPKFHRTPKVVDAEEVAAEEEEVAAEEEEVAVAATEDSNQEVAATEDQDAAKEGTLGHGAGNGVHKMVEEAKVTQLHKAECIYQEKKAEVDEILSQWSEAEAEMMIDTLGQRFGFDWKQVQHIRNLYNSAHKTDESMVSLIDDRTLPYCHDGYKRKELVLSENGFAKQQGSSEQEKQQGSSEQDFLDLLYHQNVQSVLYNNSVEVNVGDVVTHIRFKDGSLVPLGSAKAYHYWRFIHMDADPAWGDAEQRKRLALKLADTVPFQGFPKDTQGDRRI